MYETHHDLVVPMQKLINRLNTLCDLVVVEQTDHTVTEANINTEWLEVHHSAQHKVTCLEREGCT
jgi:hypothetical protein